MKSKIVTVHYCDFCKKRRFRKPDMERHEAGCTMNPNRVCRMCGGMEAAQKSIESAIAILNKSEFDTSEAHDKNKSVVEELKNHFNGCPACCLAAIRQLPNVLSYQDYDFKEHCKSYWQHRRETPL